MFDIIHPDFKETLDRFCSDTARFAVECRLRHRPHQWLTPERLQQARESALWNQAEGRHGTALTINVLVAEIESLREAAKGSLVIVNQAVTEKNLTLLKASTLLIVAEKIAPVIDEEIETRKQSCVEAYWDSLQSLSDELHAAMRLVRG